MSGTHTLSADLEALEVACRSAATYFGLQANVTSIGELVQHRLDELIEEEQRRQAPPKEENKSQSIREWLGIDEDEDLTST